MKGSKKQKAFISSAERFRRKFRRFKIISLSVIALLLTGIIMLVYVNIDFMIFRALIASNYIHTETLDELFERHLGFVPQERHYGRYFDNLVIEIVTREIRIVGNDPFTYQYSPQAHAVMQERVRTRAVASEFYEIATGVGYLRLTNISPYVQDFINANLSEIAAMDNLILDLRGNNGGELAVMHWIAGLFLERGAPLGGWTARMDFFPFSRSFRAGRSKVFDFEQIIILQNERTASSAESLIAALTENLDNTTTIGAQSFGKGIGQVTLPLLRGFAVRATVILLETPMGNVVHGVGLAPDIEHGDEGIVGFALGVIHN